MGENSVFTITTKEDKNGIYKVKIYSKLKGTAKVEIKELVMAVEYSPNGDMEKYYRYR